METNELHRGRLIDHLQLVVRDLDASRRFYQAVFDVLEIPMSGSGEAVSAANPIRIAVAGISSTGPTP